MNWLLSALQSSPLLASAMGFAFNVLAFGVAAALAAANLEEPVGLVAGEDYVYRALTEPIFVWMTIFSLPVAIICFGIGTWHYLRRGGSTS